MLKLVIENWTVNEFVKTNCEAFDAPKEWFRNLLRKNDSGIRWGNSQEYADEELVKNMLRNQSGICWGIRQESAEELVSNLLRNQSGICQITACYPAVIWLEMSQDWHRNHHAIDENNFDMESVRESTRESGRD